MRQLLCVGDVRVLAQWMLLRGLLMGCTQTVMLKLAENILNSHMFQCFSQGVIQGPSRPHRSPTEIQTVGLGRPGWLPTQVPHRSVSMSGVWKRSMVIRRCHRATPRLYY